jgi:hypothetical protein
MKSTIKLLSIILFVVLVHNSYAQNKITGYKLLNKAVKQYERTDWDINVTAQFDNPYLQEDIALDMLITAPSGKKLILPCYFETSAEKGSLWKARFLPQENGKYTYTFQLKKNGKVVQNSRTANFVSVSSDKKGILHKNDYWTFKYDNGTLYRGLGENLCWESRDNDDSKFFKELHEDKKYNYNYMLTSLAKNGGDYFRTWICSWNLPIDWKSGFNNSRYQPSDEYFNPSAVKRMDDMVNLSDSLGLHVMLTLGEGTHSKRHGRYETSTANFFIDTNAKAQYKNRLRFIVARWGYSPSIGAWEFFNEIDNIQFRNKENPINAAHIVQWHDEMSAYLAELDPYDHLITTSISHRDLEGLNFIKNIDFNQKHIYKNNRALSTTIEKYTEDFKKPYVIGEFGYEYDWQKNFDLFAEEMDSDFKRGLWYGLFSPTPILPLSWWWEYFDNRGTDKYLARVRVILDEMMTSGKGSFVKIDASADNEIEVFSVQCGDKTFIYLYNSTNQNKITNVSANGKFLSDNARIYDCESGKWKNQKLKISADNKINGIEVQAKSDVVIVL